LSLIWQNSLTRLSTEVEGHALGGGMLKLEPSEARNVLLPDPSIECCDLTSLADETDRLLRAGDLHAARCAVDEAILVGGIGLSMAECGELRAGADLLLARRLKKNVEAADGA